jgi:hypothetical protein
VQDYLAWKKAYPGDAGTSFVIIELAIQEFQTDLFRLKVCAREETGGRLPSGRYYQPECPDWAGVVTGVRSKCDDRKLACIALWPQSIGKGYALSIEVVIDEEGEPQAVSVRSPMALESDRNAASEAVLCMLRRLSGRMLTDLPRCPK